MFRSVYEVEATKDTIRKVQREITRRRNEIRRNTVANAGIAMNHVKQLEHQNNQRKAALYTHRGQIEALYRASGSTMRSSFLTPDGPRDRGNRSRPFVSIRDRMFGNEDPRIRQPQAQQAPPTKKQRKKETPPADSITMEPPATITLAPSPTTTVTPAKPAQIMQQAADSTRQNNHQLAAEKASAIRAQEDAKRDMELVSQGKQDLVAVRRKREAEERRQEEEKQKQKESRSKMNAITDRARQAESKARSKAQSFANKGMKAFNKSISKARFQPVRRGRMGARGTGLLPQLALMSAFTDKRRTQTINDATRTKESVPTGPIKDQITEDVRQYKEPAFIHSKAYHMMIEDWNREVAPLKQAIAEALQGRGMFADAAARLGPDQAKAYANRALSLIAQANEIFMNEVTRWDQGGLSSGVAVSTDTRSQSRRNMTPDEFKRYIMTKIEPMAMDFMREVEQAIQRADINATQIVSQSPIYDYGAPITTIPPAQVAHMRQTQELINYKAWYQEQSEKWLADFKQSYPSLYQRLMKVPMFVSHITYPQQRRTQMINLFSTKQLSQGNALEFAKTEIEFGWKGMIPLAVSEIKKLDPNYSTTLPNPMPQSRKRPLFPYGHGLGSFGTSRNINTPVNVQRNLSGIDKLRGHGRPVLSEQQGTKGLAGLFPALRSSMQGALRQ